MIRDLLHPVRRQAAVVSYPVIRDHHGVSLRILTVFGTVAPVTLHVRSVFLPGS